MWFTVSRTFLMISTLITVIAPSAHAQYNVDSILRQVILQLQTGTPNPGWYGAQLWQTIALQTANIGIYPQLVQLGAVTSITITQQAPLPTGMLYAATVQHQNGTSTWNLGISTLTNRIEYANVTFGPSQQPLPLSRSPGVPKTGPNPPSNPPPQDKTSPACQKFPNLC
jgi:hypothetical protein